MSVRQVDDLAVADIMEREDLDFDLFGKSNVRQFDGAPSAPAQKVYQEDLRLHSDDDFAAMEAALSSSTPQGHVSGSRRAPAAVEEKRETLDTSTLDINAYIMQQESDGNVSLFD